MENVIDEYFKSLNPLATKISYECDYVKNKYGNQWSQLSIQEQEAILDEYFLGRSVSDQIDLKDLWKVESGVKVVVDFNQDEMGWTWTDEHSGPFSWKTKSQQDLTLASLNQVTEEETRKRSFSRKEKTMKKPVPLVEADNEVFVRDVPIDAKNVQSDTSLDSNKVVQQMIMNYEEPTMLNVSSNAGDQVKPSERAKLPTKVNTLRGLKNLRSIDDVARQPASSSANTFAGQSSSPALDNVARQPINAKRDDDARQPTSPTINDVAEQRKSGFDFLDNW